MEAATTGPALCGWIAILETPRTSCFGCSMCAISHFLWVVTQTFRQNIRFCRGRQVLCQTKKNGNLQAHFKISASVGFFRSSSKSRCRVESYGRACTGEAKKVLAYGRLLTAMCVALMAIRVNGHPHPLRQEQACSSALRRPTKKSMKKRRASQIKKLKAQAEEEIERQAGALKVAASICTTASDRDCKQC